ncbi:mediator of RNA polymerase II transcription subunit 25-like isoform X2 [Hyposmocoma kahamanoa]|uniref:mediator of RNA polymerase II transcription subunit 25-like isoform X2 n=1 Tax=Hyposmocoma kahamanoa TaxID=1477025 RepID=UPI000E6D73A2|nr:mediator of RNA polymerase II transcription subunit 25-like isoform X2 [Hyposmocoma kahamanoa]
MVVNAPDAPVQAEVIFLIEVTSTNGAYINELKTNYIVPTLEYFHGGALEEGGGTGSVYSIVTYKNADCHPGLPVATYGPFFGPQEVIDRVDKLQFIGGHSESRACVTEALATALVCLDELRRADVPAHILLLCCSAPYTAYAGGLAPPGSPSTLEQAARMLCERGVQLSIASARRIAALHALYEQAGGELLAATQRNYAKDPRHLVLLRGYSLKERPPSPAPPPVPEIQTDVYPPQGRGAAPAARPPAPAFPRAAPPAARGNWLTPRTALYANNSALLTQLAQPSYPPPPPSSHNPQRLPGMAGPGPSTSSPAAVAPMQRAYIWSGVLEWMEKGKTPGDQQKVTKLLPCQVSANSKDIEPELKVDTWPNKLLMQLMPKQLISNIGGQYLKDSKSVLFHLHPNEALEALTKVMGNGYAGCVHFSSPPQCDIKVLILLYTPDKKAYLGFIPNNQATFVDRLRKVIQQQKITQIINKQMPVGGAPGALPSNMPTSTMAGTGAMPTPGMSTAMGTSMAGSSGMAGGSAMGSSAMAGSAMASSGMGGSGMGMGQVGQMGPGTVPGPSQGMQPQVQQHPQGMMMAAGMGNVGGGKGPRPVTQLDGLEAARQQNLEKIQHLQQTLEAAHQQFKSQMDIMSHLHAAQQQELNYKQLEEQQRKHQLQQQLLRGAAAGAHPPRMRPMMPSNPGLRHLLQQQPQYRPGGGPPRPPSQSQQFDDVNNYNDIF